MVFVGRQPILDRQRSLYGYELLFRDGQSEVARISNAEKATWNVVTNALVDIGLDSLVGRHLAFINLTHSALTAPDMQVLPPGRVVLEVLEDVNVDTTLIEAVRALSKSGYRIALDDFVYDPTWDPLIALSSIVKLDIRALGIEGVRAHVARLGPTGVSLLAEKVETEDEFIACRDMGFDFFQGHFFARPVVITGQRLPSTKLAILQLLANLNDPNADFQQIEKIVSRDLALSVRLLRYVNSAGFALARKVDSIRRAVTYLGLKQLRRWASLLVMTGHTDKPTILLQTILVRARMCELLAELADVRIKDSYFTAGLFSGLDALMDATMSDVIADLPLSDEIKNALLHHQGPMGEAIRCALSCEQAESDATAFPGLSSEQIRASYMEAIQWASRIGADFGIN